MTTYNFYTRDFFYYKPDGSAPDNQRNFFTESTDGNGNKIYVNNLSFANSTELFCLFPESNDTFTGPTSPRSPYRYKVSNTTRNVPINYVFGDLSTTSGTLKLCYDIASSANPYYEEIYMDNTKWETRAWTPTSNYSNFKTQVTNFLATNLEANKNVVNQQLNKITSWNVYFYMRQVDGTKSFVMFYPGNDAQGTLVQVVK